MEYRVNLNLLFYNDDRSCHLRAEKEITLPFVPYVGLSFEEKGIECPMCIQTVIWSIDKKYFYCRVEEEAENIFEFDDDIDNLREIFNTLRDAKKNGWVGFDKIYRDK